MYKRRRLNSSTNTTFSTILSTTPANILPLPASSCKTCHRTLRSVNVATTCPRCKAVVCTICSRTCTEYTHTPSYPPTPALTRSPSPSPTSVAPSPFTQTTNHEHTPLAGRRRKFSSNLTLKVYSEGGRGMRLEDRNTEERTNMCLDDFSLDERARDSSTSTILGCGLTVCRDCCIESIQSEGTLCLDCYARV
ncbi:hypothetical protein BJ138DRAFT_278557 [Hygrophoropsis aurantiaca]|uniref:Uncharacterized protein n=1 Tax=Hygrophoropsis aurantiaca TaxID=72124 RepID=A0ACB8A680_9AGAM|nr:hypothetical protein BJ138DRAFT_278557 [Hygrophoropsis aurantiaca]